ncbi:Coatomer subunit zeta-2, partial [Eschrichtius robustus]|nr:Coatomer subunit zeta-2 [Eschrichtius robustus]
MQGALGFEEPRRARGRRGEIAFFGGMTIVYKSSIDLFLYVVGSSYENELMLMSVLTCLFESLNHVLRQGPGFSWPWGGSRAVSAFRKNVEKRWLLENMDGAFLVLDEIVDGGQGLGGWFDFQCPGEAGSTDTCPFLGRLPSGRALLLLHLLLLEIHSNTN